MQNQNDMTRRQILAGFAAGAAAVAMSGASREAFAMPQASTPSDEGKIKRAVTPKLEPFELSAVRLLEGPFLDAQKRDEKYLLSLEPDRMLANFRKNAGLDPKAPVYGGWESVQPWIDIRCHGHTLGHYLSACAMMYASTGADEFKNRCDYIISELKACQDASKTGLICAFPDNAAPFEAIAAGRNFPGVIWYTMHKIFAGLRDAHLFARSPAALDIAAKLADFCIATTEKLTDAQFQRMLGVEHGGMNEVLGDIYVLTGQQKYLTLAERFCHRQVMDPLAQGRDTLGTLHSNTQIPKFIGFKRLHELTGKPEYLAAARFFWETVTRTRSFATGGNGDNEHFFPITDFARHLSSAKTMETCCSHNMLRLTRALFLLQPSAELGDYYERALYNTILASQDPDSGMFTYFQPTRPGYAKIFCTPTDSFWCCTGTGMENHAKYGDSIYFHGDKSLYVNLFIPSRLTWKEKGLTITQTTKFPEAARTTLTFTADAPVEMTLNLRHPSWCKIATVTVNRDPNRENVYGTRTTSEAPGSFVTLSRTWKSGDVVEIDLPMPLHAELLPGTTDTVAVMFGPLALAGKLGKEGITPGSDIIINERTIGTMLNQPVEVPTLVGDGVKVVQNIKPVEGKALTFIASSKERPDGVTLVPYYAVAHERYSLYWKLSQ
ncbi:MAG TPA: beta-L-arabinofuranosidase domain-containing protein [Phycisphaerae bacterium]|nr:beta-L-arabinofuranosidase domain-containing protein [Phycisphaerae bacterium]